MSTVIPQPTRTTRSGTRVVTASSSNTSIRSTATTSSTSTTTITKIPGQRDVKARTLSLRDPRAPARIDTRAAPPQRDLKTTTTTTRTPVLRETRSKRELVSPAPTTASASASASASTSSLPALAATAADVSAAAAAAHASGVRSPSPDPPPTGVLPGPSPLALFVANIKLLGLDSLPDWPRITTQTFVPPGPGTQGQRRRIHCAEWVFFQLFSLWDPEETESKLKPFYPPVDQNQSIEFRAALLKSLERAKKMGALSRDSLVRKSTLDDCKAERLEELLASFSTAVLKKVVLEKHATTGARVNPILGIATQHGRKADKMELSALTVTYKSSLKKMVERREATRVRYRDFANLLDLKEQAVARRHDAILAEEIRNTDQWVSDNGRADMRNTLRSNWSGDNDVWMEALYSGDAKGTGLLTTHFDKVWEKLHQGRLGELETVEGSGLLQQLESRVRVQKERLQKWNAFRRDTFGQSAAATGTQSKVKVASAPSKGFDLGFEDHRHLQVGKVHRLSLKNRVHEVGMSADYCDIISGLNEDLARISQKDVDLAKLWAERLPKKDEKSSRRRSPSGYSVDDDSASDISELDDAEGALLSDIHLPSFQDKSSGSNGSSIRPKLSRPDLLSISVEGSSGPAISLGKRNFPGKSSYDLAQLDQYDLSTPPTPPKETQPTTPKSKGRKPHKMDMNESPGPMLTHRIVMSPTRYIADNDNDNHNDDDDSALDAVGITSPSPVKQSPSPVKRTKPRHTLSLTERTQLSLTRKSSFFLEDDEPDLVHEPASICSSTVDHTPEELDSRAASSTEMADDLVSRTQRSMAGFEKAQQKAQLERRRSQRRSKILPRKESGYFSRGDEDLISLVERLAEQEDMEAVFRSRPKIGQTSPSSKGWGQYPDYYA